MAWGCRTGGNRTSSGLPGFPQVTATYDVTGMPVSVAQGGTTTNLTSYDVNNVAPTQITTSNLAVTTTHNQLYETLSTSGPNGATTSAAYDAAARPTYP